MIIKKIYEYVTWIVHILCIFLSIQDGKRVQITKTKTVSPPCGHLRPAGPAIQTYTPSRTSCCWPAPSGPSPPRVSSCSSSPPSPQRSNPFALPPWQNWPTQLLLKTQWDKKEGRRKNFSISVIRDYSSMIMFIHSHKKTHIIHFNTRYLYKKEHTIDKLPTAKRLVEFCFRQGHILWN